MKSSVRRLVESQYDRRSFFKTLGASAAGAAVAGWLWDEDVEGAVKNVRRNSIPSQLKITDLRVAVITGAPMNVPLIRIDTNQGVSGYGEVRDGGSKIPATSSRRPNGTRIESMTVYGVRAIFTACMV